MHKIVIATDWNFIGFYEIGNLALNITTYKRFGRETKTDRLTEIPTFNNITVEV